MFTGLIEVLGTVLSVTSLDTTVSGGGGFSIVIGNCSKILEDVALGDSIVCNGSPRTG
jgi:riboflavin synthase